MVQAFRRRPRAWRRPAGQIVSLPPKNQFVCLASRTMKLFEQAGKLKGRRSGLGGGDLEGETL
jgi:hypothetical protein